MTLSTVQTLPNRMNPADLHATLGLDSGVASDDPVGVVTARDVIFLPGSIGNYLLRTDYGTRPGTDDYVEVSILLCPGQALATLNLVGTNSTHLALTVTSGGKLRIRHLGTGSVGMGDVDSPTALGANWAVGQWVWLRARLTRATALCEYWCALTETDQDDPDAVNWVSLGSAVGINAGLDFLTAASASFLIGAHTTAVAGMRMLVRACRQDWGGAQIRDFVANDVTGWNVTRSSTGAKTAVVTDNVLLPDGVNDFVQLPLAAYSGALTADETVMVGLAMQSDATLLNQAILLNRASIGGGVAAAGFGLRATINPGVSWTLLAIGGDGTTWMPTSGQSLSSIPFGTPLVVGYEMNQATRNLKVFWTDGVSIVRSAGTSLGSLGSCASGLPARVGLSTSGGSALAAEVFMPFARAPRLLPESDLLSVAGQLIGRAFL